MLDKTLRDFLYIRWGCTGMRANLSVRTIKRIRERLGDNRIGYQGYSYSVDLALEKILDMLDKKE